MYKNNKHIIYSPSGSFNICFQNNNSETIKKLERDNASINYKISGHGDTTLLFVHGSYIDQTYWKQQVEYFSPHYTVVTLDLAGHGKSGKAREHWSVQGFGEDVICSDQ